MNYVYTVEQCKFCLNCRTEYFMSMQLNRVNYVYTVERSELYLHSRTV